MGLAARGYLVVVCGLCQVVQGPHGHQPQFHGAAYVLQAGDVDATGGCGRARVKEFTLVIVYSSLMTENRWQPLSASKKGG